MLVLSSAKVLIFLCDNLQEHNHLVEGYLLFRFALSDTTLGTYFPFPHKQEAPIPISKTKVGQNKTKNKSNHNNTKENPSVCKEKKRKKGKP